jgi:hypothetical protein
MRWYVNECKTCENLLESWSVVARAHSLIVSRLVLSKLERHPGFYDEANDAFELAVGAREIYRLHREEHEYFVPRWRVLENGTVSSTVTATFSCVASHR